MKVMIDIAYSFGVNAFNKGQNRIPEQDEFLVKECLDENPGEDCSPYLEAWLRGWDDAALKVTK